MGKRKVTTTTAAREDAQPAKTLSKTDRDATGAERINEVGNIFSFSAHSEPPTRRKKKMPGMAERTRRPKQ